MRQEAVLHLWYLQNSGNWALGRGGRPIPWRTLLGNDTAHSVCHPLASAGCFGFRPGVVACAFLFYGRRMRSRPSRTRQEENLLCTRRSSTTTRFTDEISCMSRLGDGDHEQELRRVATRRTVCVCVCHPPPLPICAVCAVRLAPSRSVLCCLCCLLCLPCWNNSRGRDSSELCIGA